MGLSPGSKVGPYEIQSLIGKGGMGEVYKAHDPRLRRDVAVKTSAQRFNERFEREARAIAALNHPNICQIYDVGPDYLVMEYIDGPALADRIKEGAIPLDEALTIARQIAAALEAAHDRAITHRDLKPGNIKIAHDGTVKVLDFGLAKIGGERPAAISEDSPTLSMAATQAGVILGTAAYMAPEQAKGKPVDKRADIWAFGVVLYEMVTGKRLFQGEDMLEVLAAVVNGQPDLSAVPAKVRPLIARCLEKDPKQRLRDMSGLEFLLAGKTSAGDPPLGGKLAWIAAAAALALAAGTAWTLWPQPPKLQPMTRLEVDLGKDVALNAASGPDVVISPDGSRLAYSAGGRLYSLSLDLPDARPLELGPIGGGMAFSVDGNWIAFGSGGLKKVASRGGSPLLLGPNPQNRGIAWKEDGQIVVSPNLASVLVETGGSPTLKPLTKLQNNETAHRWPQVLPGDRAVIFTAGTGGNYYGATVEVQSLRDGSRKTLVQGGTFGRVVFASDGSAFLTYMNRDTLFAQPFDPETLSVRSTAAPVLVGVGYNPADGGALLDFSRDGTLVYRTGSASGSRIVQFMNATGTTERILAKSDAFTYPRLSPDGKRLLVVGTEGGTTDLWVYDVKDSRSARLTIGVGATFNPIWTPDGRYVIYQGPGGLFWTRSDGSGQPQPLLVSKNIQYPSSVSLDGKRLAYMEISPETTYDLWTAPLEITESGIKAGTPEKFLQTPNEERHAMFSPDGKWIAYSSNETGKWEVYVRPFPNTGGRWTVSVGGGHYPAWSREKNELYYRTEDGQVMVANYVAKGDTFSSDAPRKFSDKKLAPVYTNGTYDVAPGGRIVGLFPAEDEAAKADQSHVTFLLHFADEIARRVGGGK